MKSQDVRAQFLQFFQDKQHTIVPSAPMVMKNDPTLMFTNAGMNQFKEYFLGNSKPTSNRVSDSQKCLRVSGKHNDLDEVGIDTYHHTMFEMLGNWSFGDYFKKEAILWAWELLTEVYKIDKNSLYVSVFEGSDDADNLEMDNEAFDLWKAIVPEDRIIMGNKKDNFWEMGNQGPCGPCSEIHVDIRSEDEKARVSGKKLVNQDHPQVVEIWNLVFMQYNRRANGQLEELPAKHIDTGMGFERLCMVLQGVKSNYDTDVFTPLIREVEAITQSKYGVDEKTDIAIRVITDHVRAVAFSIADGQLPSNTGAGYVIRRILRRAIRYGFTFLNAKQVFIFKLINTLSKQMGAAFPELQSQKKLIENVIREEEQSFLRTLDQGLKLLDTVMKVNRGKQIEGSKAFELYDTYGFPIDLTELIARENGMTVDMKAFTEALEKQRQRSRSAGEVQTDDWQELMDDVNQEFIGYDCLKSDVRIVRYRKVESKKGGIQYQLVFNRTPFYPEGGGQVGDIGYLESPNGDLTYITDTKKENNLVIHITKGLPTNVNDTFKAVVDEHHRQQTASNHTATHLMHQALRTTLGKHVEQKGSMVHSNYLRFDFSHFSKVTADELRQIEDFVNARINDSITLDEHRAMPYQQAIEKGAIALFGEKYGDVVRAIRFGESIELCGGTHVQNTNEIWHFIITSESSVAAGIRRIEAITKDAAKEYFDRETSSYKAIKAVLKNNKEPLKAVVSLQEENASLKKQIQQLLQDRAKNFRAELKNEVEEIDGINFIARKLNLDAGGIKSLCFDLGNEVDNLFAVFGSHANGKAILSCYVSKNLVVEKSLNAGQIIRKLGTYIQGDGGGQPFFATAGGKNPAGIDKALAKAKDFLN